MPPRVLLNAVEGWGKTTIGAFSEKPLMVMARDETGYPTLLRSGRVPSIDAVAPQTWGELLALCDKLIAAPSGHKTLVLDAAGGFERMCLEHVCKRDYKGDWSESGFEGFQRGYKTSINDWMQFLQRLDRIHASGVMILMLAHSKVGSSKNPLGADYDKYIVDMSTQLYGVTGKWVDDILFGDFFVAVEGGKTGERARKGKAIGGTQRILYTEQSAGYIAKNRHGMPPEMEIPNDHTQAWATIWSAITGENPS